MLPNLNACRVDVLFSTSAGTSHCVGSYALCGGCKVLCYQMAVAVVVKKLRGRVLQQAGIVKFMLADAKTRWLGSLDLHL